MLEDPELDFGELAAVLRDAYAIQPMSITFVPGYDMRAASYDVAAADGRWFAKVRFGSAADVPLEVPRALLDAGVSNVLAPVRTLASTLSHRIDDRRTVVVYPFVAGPNAVVAGMTADQWRTFGMILRAVHDSGLQAHFGDRLPAETFALPSAAHVRKVLGQPPSVDSPPAVRLRTFLVENGGRIGAMLERAEQLGARLRDRRFERVLVHSDIHAANVLVADDGRILLVDWDGPMLAPRERDLLFVIGSRIARDVQPPEQAWFFEGYGDVPADGEAIVYYRYERILEDIGEFARSVFDDHLPEASRESQVALVESFFVPGGILESVEHATWRASHSHS